MELDIYVNTEINTIISESHSGSSSSAQTEFLEKKEEGFSTSDLIFATIDALKLEMLKYAAI